MGYKQRKSTIDIIRAIRNLSHTLIEQMTEENEIKRIDLWNFIQEHKNNTKEEFGGWLVGQEVIRTDKIIMAVDLWNDIVKQR